MSTTPTEDVTTGGSGTRRRTRLIVFRVLATLAGLLFLLAVVLSAPAPWLLLQSGPDPNADLDRWFITVAAAWTPSQSPSSSPSCTPAKLSTPLRLPVPLLRFNLDRPAARVRMKHLRAPCSLFLSSAVW